MATIKRGNLVEDDETQSDVLQNADDENFEINLEDVSEDSGVYQPVPRGTYAAEIVESEYTRSKSNPDNRMIHLVFEVRVPEGDDEYYTRKINHWLVLTEKMYGRVKAAIVVLAPDFPLNPFRPSDAAFELMGKKCRVKVDIERDKNDRTKMYNRITGFLEAAEEEDGENFFNN